MEIRNASQPFLPPDADWRRWPELKALADAFSSGGAEIRIVGGAVRDTLLARDVQEVDLATQLTPPEVVDLLTRAGIRAIPTGIAHGTVTALMGAHGFEITTLRRDAKCDGRHAEVVFSQSWEEDARRRDFTINALYADFEGKISDFTGGISDLEAKNLRFIGEATQRVREDYLRILRYYRFAAQLGFPPENNEARRACRAEAPGISRLSGERIAAEMMKMLSLAVPDDAVWSAMQDDGVFAEAFGFEGRRSLSPIAAAEHGLSLKPDPLRRLAFLLPSAQACEMLRARWKLSNADGATLRLLLVHRGSITDAMTEKAQKALLRKLGGAAFLSVVAIAWADEMTNNTGLQSVSAYAAMGALARGWTIPQFPLRGQDLLAHGLMPGAALGEALLQLEAIWEAEDYRPDKEALLARLASSRGEAS